MESAFFFAAPARKSRRQRAEAILTLCCVLPCCMWRNVTFSMATGHKTDATLGLAVWQSGVGIGSASGIGWNWLQLEELRAAETALFLARTCLGFFM